MNRVALTLKTAERLKMLRERAGLSHEKLKNEIKEYFGVDISKSSLINYEASEWNSKSGTNAGMKIEYLRCLAQYYGVSADFILGISDYETPDVNAQSASKHTGLSEYAVNRLNVMKNGYGPFYRKLYFEILNGIICSVDFDGFMLRASDALSIKLGIPRREQDEENKIDEDTLKVVEAAKKLLLGLNQIGYYENMIIEKAGANEFLIQDALSRFEKIFREIVEVKKEKKKTAPSGANAESGDMQ